MANARWPPPTTDNRPNDHRPPAATSHRDRPARPGVPDSVDRHGGDVSVAADGRLVITVVDRDTGKPIAARMHLRRADGKARKPKGVPFWHDHFVFPGQIALDLPKGNYFFELERGPEYLTQTGHFTIERVRRRHEADRHEAVRRHVGPGLVVGRSGRSPAGRRDRTGDAGRRPARGHARNLVEPARRQAAQGRRPPRTKRRATRSCASTATATTASRPAPTHGRARRCFASMPPSRRASRRGS